MQAGSKAKAVHQWRLEGPMPADSPEGWLSWAFSWLPNEGYVGWVQATVRPDRSVHVDYILFFEA